MTRTKAVLFDLDDTLFDHAFAARCALEGVRASLPRFVEKPFEFAVSETFARHRVAFFAPARKR